MSDSLVRKATRYGSSPDHWTFLLGEIALYSFVVLVATASTSPSSSRRTSAGPSSTNGPFEALRGAEVTQAYRSTLELSSTVPGGLMMRQTHHWAALGLRRGDDRPSAARVLHRRLPVPAPGDLAARRGGCWPWACSRASRATRCPTTCSGGMGLAIAYAVALSIPLLGGAIGRAGCGGGEFPGPGVIQSRLYILHVLVLPGVMAAVIAGAPRAHRAPQAHAVRRARAPRGQRPVGHNRCGRATALRSRSDCCARWPRCSCCSAASCKSTRCGSGVPTRSTAHQRRAARLVPGLADRWPAAHAAAGDPGLRAHRSCRTRSGADSPSRRSCSACWPRGRSSSRACHANRARHDLLDRPRDHPWRTAFGVAFFTWVALIFVAGASDRLVLTSSAFPTRARSTSSAPLALIAPPSPSGWPKTTCDELRRTQARPGLGGPGRRWRRRDDGGFDVVGK